MKIIEKILWWGWLSAAGVLLVFSIISAGTPGYGTIVSTDFPWLFSILNFGSDRPILRFDGIGQGARFELISAGAGFVGITGAVLNFLSLMGRISSFQKKSGDRVEKGNSANAAVSDADRFWEKFRAWIAMSALIGVFGWVFVYYFVLGNSVPVSTQSRLSGAIIAMTIAPCMLVTLICASILTALGYEKKARANA